MPVTVICGEHPDVDVTYPGDFLMHKAAAHPDESLQAVADKCVTTSITHEAANGRKPPPRRFRCRYCAADVVTSDPDRPLYCDLHLDRA